MDGVSISFKGDLKALTKDLDKIQRTVVPQVTASALNKSAAMIRTRATKSIARDKQITPQKLVRARLKIQKANKRRLFVWLVALTADIPVSKMKHRQTAAGVKSGRRFFKSAFVASMPSGHRGPFARKGRARLPVKKITISIRQKAENIINKLIKTYGGREFKKLFERELRFRLQRKGLL